MSESKSQELAYLLSADLDRFCHIERGEGYDLQAFSFDGLVTLREISQSKGLNLPSPIFFYQHKRPEYIDKLDSLHTLEGCPVFSQRMIDVLLSVHKFKYEKYRISVLEKMENINPYENVEKFEKMSLRDDLFIFQTLESLDVFDWEQSDYRSYGDEDGYPSHVRKYVLKEPQDSFPPLFRLLYPKARIQSERLFISKEAREALRHAGITGTAFMPLSQPRGNSEIDVPVEDSSDLELDNEVEKHQKKIERVFKRAEEERLKGDNDLADRLEQQAHDLMRDIGY